MRAGVARVQHRWASILYSGGMALAALLVLRLQLLPQLAQGFPGLVGLWALGYGLTDAGLLTVYTLIQHLRSRA